MLSLALGEGMFFPVPTFVVTGVVLIVSWSMVLLNLSRAPKALGHRLHLVTSVFLIMFGIVLDGVIETFSLGGLNLLPEAIMFIGFSLLLYLTGEIYRDLTGKNPPKPVMNRREP